MELKHQCHCGDKGTGTAQGNEHHFGGLGGTGERIQLSIPSLGCTHHDHLILCLPGESGRKRSSRQKENLAKLETLGKGIDMVFSSGCEFSLRRCNILKTMKFSLNTNQSFRIMNWYFLLWNRSQNLVLRV